MKRLRKKGVKMVLKNQGYIFKFVLTDESVRKRIVDYITPIIDKWDVINLQFAYCIKEINSNTFFARIRTAERVDDNTGKQLHSTYLYHHLLNC